MTPSSHSQVFSTNRRLHYSWEYRRFFAQNQVFRLPQCVVFRIPNEFCHYRLGITLKARGSSVERNRVKRQIRESFRIQGMQLGSYDYNVVIPQAKKMNFTYSRALGECLRRQLLHVISNS